MKHDPRLTRSHYQAEVFRLRVEQFMLAGAALIIVGLTSLVAHGLAALAQWEVGL